MNILVHPTAFNFHAPHIDGANDADVYRTLLESTQAIPWKIDWATMRFTYVGPQIEQLLGWARDSWITVEDWAMRIDEVDRERVVNFCVSQSQAGIDHEADYRALTPTGEKVWIRDVVHVVRNEDGGVDSLVGFMFDISERKRTEERLIQLQQKLESLSFADALTGIANRRRFDMRIDQEWKCLKRGDEPLSMIVIDVDYFKQYNDHYGHAEGDTCLVAIATALNGLARRPRDLAARLGGEEFTLLLPQTGHDGAREIATACIDAIAALAIPHARSTVAAHVTASLGVATIADCGNGTASDFFVAVDELLYAAKRNGRNRYEAAVLGPFGVSSVPQNPG